MQHTLYRHRGVLQYTCPCVFFLLCVCVCHTCMLGLSAILSVHFYYQRPFFTVRNTITFSVFQMWLFTHMVTMTSTSMWIQQWHRPACEYSNDIDQPVNTAVCQLTLDDTWWFRPPLHTAYSLWHSDWLKLFGRWVAWLKLFGRWVALKLLWPTDLLECSVLSMCLIQNSQFCVRIVRRFAFFFPPSLRYGARDI